MYKKKNQTVCCYPPPKSATRWASIGGVVGCITEFVETKKKKKKKIQMWLLPPLISLHELPWQCVGGRFSSHHRAIRNPHDGCMLLMGVEERTTRYCYHNIWFPSKILIAFSFKTLVALLFKVPVILSFKNPVLLLLKKKCGVLSFKNLVSF